MSSQLVRLAALAVIFVMCATLVVGIPQLFVDESDQQETSGDEPLTRTRRGSGQDSIPAGGHHHQSYGGHGGGHEGWGWPKKQQGWGWPKQQGWGWPSVGPVFTYVRTDGWSNFQWGVRHKVGGNKGWGGWQGRRR